MSSIERAATYWRGMWVTTCILAVSTGVGGNVHAQIPEEGGASVKPSPVTTADPGISTDHLKLLVRPLTKDELVIEADAWQDLLKVKLQEIAERSIAIQQQTETVDQTASGDDGVSAAQKEQLAEELPTLLEQQANLVERLDVVVGALEAKGGDVESYRQYVSAVKGLSLGISDSGTAWTVFSGWLVSEQGGKRWLWNIAKFVVILFAFFFGASMIASFARQAVSRFQGGSQLLVDFVGRFVKQLLMIIGFIVALAALEVDITPLLAAIGAAGFVVAFALQDTLSNFASGLLILAYRPFDVGDAIDAAGVSGIVDSVSLFSTHVRTFDNKMMIVPNNEIWGGTITNATASDTRRVDLVFGIGYGDDIEKAKRILEQVVKEHQLVLDEPAPVIQLHELADSSVNFVCRPWTKTGDYWAVYWDITRRVKEEVDRNDISIPFPQRDVHIYQEAVSTAKPS